MNEQELAKALRRLNDATVPPPVDTAREAALMSVFDQARRAPVRSTGGYWYMSALATAAAVLIAILAHTEHPASRSPLLSPRSTLLAPRSSLVAPGTDFIVAPGADNLPPMESGTLVRIDVPVSMLPSLGVTPPASGGATVRADLVIGQDGLTRAVRLVN